MSRYMLRFQFDNGSEKVVTLDSEFSLEQVNAAVYTFFQGRSPIQDIAVNPNRLLAIQIQPITQPQESRSEDVAQSEESVLG